MDGSRDLSDRNDLFVHSWRQANNRAICTTVVLKMLKTNWGAEAEREHESVTGTTTHFSSDEIGESVATLRERPAEERLHRAQERRSAVKSSPSTATAV